jgi:hypothetical protein
MLNSQRFLLLFSKRSAFLLAGLLCSCGDDPPPVVHTFPPLQYSYLPKLRLNVGAIDVQDHSLPVSPQDVAASSPAVPAQVLAQDARDRLFAAGTAGTAVFTIDQASIVRGPGGTLDGRLAAHLTLTTANGQPGGFAEAQVVRQHVPGSDPEDESTQLYDLTRQMMADMNVELEYQIRRTLSAALVEPGAAPAAVVAQPLDAPVAAVPAPPALPPGTPPDTAFQDPEAPAPVEMSPPPGYLQVPR